MIAPQLTHATFLQRMDSPIGRLLITADEESILSVTIERDHSLPLDNFSERPNRVTARAARQLRSYFNGTRRRFNLPIRLGGTPFQNSIWQKLSELGWGEVTTYGELGRSVGLPAAGRAVGGAIRANRIAILVPCHRVLGSAGTITGYSQGAGIPTKSWLLDHEGTVHSVRTAPRADELTATG
jgi:methylated-DNA-[protein]-cysteine S-methyltransferase